jgi:hypothetical protein
MPAIANGDRETLVATSTASESSFRPGAEIGLADPDLPAAMAMTRAWPKID